eukprot:TRINITY_DN1442_c0_g2_i5.p1 TRINITY_DN1442_c0_g2~~TRINITY_DN1442_c0_g2_i5.p1  ORF type:complete len:190 (+),score=45.02 TRINITY_DN1442_c0_g2_i5:91-660(+)
MASLQTARSHAKAGEAIWAKMDKISAELFAMTYGAIVVQLLKDFEDVETVNVELEKMGYNIGMRLVDEFLAKSAIVSCHNFRETAEVIGKIAFKMFLGTTAEITNWSTDSRQFSLLVGDNPLIDFVELPPAYRDLVFCNLLCGVIRGALEMVQLKVECEFVRDVLRGDEVSEIRVRLLEILQEQYQEEE